jgi:hypothetical protein
MLIHSAEITGSVQLNNTDVSAITNVAGFATTASLNTLIIQTGSYATTGSNQFNGNQSISGSITSNGTITAQTLVVQTVTSSIEFVTGSTKNGSLAENTHQFTGSVLMSNSLGIGTSSPNFNSYGTALTLLSSLNYGGIEVYGSGSTKGGQIDFGSGNIRYASISGEYESSDNGFIQIRTRRAGTMTDAVRITASGSVGIGQSSPTVLLDLKKAHAAAYNSVVDLINLNGYFPGYDVDSQRAGIQAGVPNFGNTTYGQIGFATRGADGYQTRVKVMPDGLRFSGGASSINYYEEGSWTPAIRGNGSFGTAAYQFRSGTYVRIGNYVFVRWGFKLSSFSGASGTMQITGLPFTAVNWGSYQEPNIAVSTGNLATADYAQRARVFVTSGGDVMEGRIANNSDTAWPVSEFNGDEWIIGEIFYNIA